MGLRAKPFALAALRHSTRWLPFATNNAAAHAAAGISISPPIAMAKVRGVHGLALFPTFEKLALLRQSPPFWRSWCYRQRMDLICPRLPSIALWSTLGTISLFGQTAAVVASGYALPVTPAAPGELVTITASGLEKITPDYIRSAKPPLPLTLGGVSVTLHQTAALPADLAVPLLGIDQWDDCGQYEFETGPNCLMTGITLQIPYEMAQFHPDLAGTVDRAWLVVHQNGKDTVPFRITAVMNHIHILTECDRFFFPWFGRRPTISPCPAIVAHADGSQVTSIVPARPGEALIIYAVGLGLPNQAVQSGDVSPSPAATVDRAVYLQYSFRPNATPSISYVDPSGSNELSQPRFVGLTPGQVGLYQINVRLPGTFPQVPQCGTIPNSSINVQLNIYRLM